MLSYLSQKVSPSLYVAKLMCHSVGECLVTWAGPGHVTDVTDAHNIARAADYNSQSLR